MATVWFRIGVKERVMPRFSFSVRLRFSISVMGSVHVMVVDRHRLRFRF